MKPGFVCLMLLPYIAAFSQITVTVDVGNVLKTLSGRENGINVNYLMDGTYLSPAISPARSLENVKAKLLRYPGGEKSDNYLFSAPPYTLSSPRMALRGKCFWPSNDPKFVDTSSADGLCRPEVLDFDEFMAICNTVDAEPLVVVAYDAAYNKQPGCAGKPTKAQLLDHAVQWVRYANVKKGYNVKYWMIGNESWHDSMYNGRVSPSQYAKDVEEFARAMKGIDPAIKIIANGIRGWWKTILQSSAVRVIDFLGVSEYPVFNYKGGYEHYRHNDINLTGEIDAAIRDIDTYAPEADKSRLKVIATEYSSVDWSGRWPNDNNMGHALANFQMFGDMIVKPKVEAACMWNSRWTDNALIPQHLYDAFDAEGRLNATGNVMNIWGNNLLQAMVSTTDDDFYVKSYASYDSATKKLNIFLMNKDDSAKRVKLNISGYETDFTGSKWQMSGNSVADKFPVYFCVDSISEPLHMAEMVLPANSITVLNLEGELMISDRLLRRPQCFCTRTHHRRTEYFGFHQHLAAADHR